MKHSVVDEDDVDRAIAAVTSLVVTFGLAAQTVTVVSDSNKLGLRLLPCDVFARVATAGNPTAAFEIEVAKQLAAAGAPAVPLRTPAWRRTSITVMASQ